VDTLIHDALGVVAQELQDVLNLSLVRQATEANAVLSRAGRDELLRDGLQSKTPFIPCLWAAEASILPSEV